MAMFMLCETSVHAGAGSELGIVDLPIQRERHTDYPVFYSSSIKGALRFNIDRAKGFWEIFKRQLESDENILIKNLIDVKKFEGTFEAIFGEKENRSDEESYASSIAITDAKILLFPVKSLKGTFAYITCPFVIHRLKRDFAKAELELLNMDVNFSIRQGEALVTKDSDVVVNNGVTLEEFTLTASEDDAVNDLAKVLAETILPKDNVYDYLKNKIKRSLVVLSDDDFREFVSQSTEVIARVKIDEKTRTVSGEGGEGPWYEENLPAETVLYSLIFAQDVSEMAIERKKLDNQISAEQVLNFLEHVVPDRIQLGGNETIGRGILAIRFFK